VRTLVRERAVASAHDLGEGGLAVALAECSFGPAGIGANIELDSELSPELALFHEGPSRVLVTTDNPERVMRETKQNGVEALTIGITIGGMLRMSQRGAVLFESSLEELREPWAEYLGSIFQAAVVA
jgi:phosphoribosylformylglycinamidine (FGAM) synthase-like enzyme